MWSTSVATPVQPTRPSWHRTLSRRSTRRRITGHFFGNVTFLDDPDGNVIELHQIGTAGA